MRKLIKIIITVSLIIACSSCDKIFGPKSENPDYQEDFEEIWNIADAYYPFFELKNIQWDSIYEEYSPRVRNAEGDDALSVLSQLINELKDGHSSLLNRAAFPLTNYTLPRVMKDKDTYNPLVVRRYFTKELKISGDLEYEILQDSLGYLCIATFANKGQWLENFEEALEYLLDTKGLIIDVRHNGGGDTKLGNYYIIRLISSPLEDVVWYDRVSGWSSPTTYLPSGRFQYTKPIVLLINGVSYSATNTFANLCKKVEHITLVGDTTGGGAGVPEKFRLPSGLIFKMSTGFTMRYDGEHMECSGIPPDILIPQTKEDIDNNQDKQLEYAIDYLNEL